MALLQPALGSGQCLARRGAQGVGDDRAGMGPGPANPFDTGRGVCYIITRTAEVVELVDTLA